MKYINSWLAVLAVGCLIVSCQSNANHSEAGLSNTSGFFNDYWYQGKAELSSFTLEQARYGELHKGEAVLIYVTEDFSASKQVKLDDPYTAGNDRVPVLKLNATKYFNTGIYPYSIMTSSFMPVDLEKNAHALKVTTSVQEWCGHVFMQINNKGKQFQVNSKSYFESEGDTAFNLESTYLEDELWNIIRINPDKLPIGNQSLIPGTAFSRLKHIEIKAYQAELTLSENPDDTKTYAISYPALQRTLTITFQTAFPYQILSWEEEYMSGWGSRAKKLKSTAVLNKTLITDYWTKNTVSDLKLREDLGLNF